MKKTKTIRLSEEILEWTEKMIEKREFGSLSHAVEKALYELKKSYDA